MVTVPRPLSGRKEPIGSPPLASRLGKSAACPTLGRQPNSVTAGLRQLSSTYFTWEAHVQYGYSLTAIGQHLGLHYTTIRKIAQRQQRAQTERKC